MSLISASDSDGAVQNVSVEQSPRGSSALAESSSTNDVSVNPSPSLPDGHESRMSTSPDFGKDEGIFEAFEEGECRDGLSCFLCVFLG